jgi:hypothetical protein
MNCFNVRELQALLKNRFFNELVSSKDHHSFLEQTAIGLRFKLNELEAIHSNIVLMYHYGVTSEPQVRSQTYDGILCGKFPKEALFDKSGVMWKLIVELNALAQNILLDSLYRFLFSVTASATHALALKYPQIHTPVSVNGWVEAFASFGKRECDWFVEAFSHTTILIDDFTTLFFRALDIICHSLMVANGAIFTSTITLPSRSSLSTLLKDARATIEFTIYRLKKFLFGSEDFMYCYENLAASFYHYVTVLYWDPSNTSNLLLNYIIFVSKENFSSATRLDITNLNGPGVVGKVFRTLLGGSLATVEFVFGGVLYMWHALQILPGVVIAVISSSFSTWSEFSQLGRVLIAPATWLGLTDTNTAQYFIKTLCKFLSSPSYVVFGKSASQFVSDVQTTESFYQTNVKAFEETSSSSRTQRSQNPIFKPDFKSGNFFTREDFSRKPFLLTTISDITKGMRRPAWFLADAYSDALTKLKGTYVSVFQQSSESPKGDMKVSETFIHNPYGFFNTFSLFSTSRSLDVEKNDGISKEYAFMNQRWLALNVLDQKFYRMYTTMSTQQRVVSNWRQLKFTREGWRCRLLSARHQKTLFRRYVKEDGMLWAFERNAKDVLPGWAMITPFSARTRFTAIGKVDIGLMGVFLVLNSSIVSSANFLVTYRYLSTLNNRKMRDARSFFTEGVIVASWMMIAANPMLAIGILMLLSDRHWQTSFFDYSGGGDTVLFQHMFWFFGHPEVYVIMIPAFGFTNTILSYYLRKRVSARASLMYSMYTIAFLGFFVWGHHMYMVGLAHTTRMLFSTLTVMISVPAATKLMHWCVTLVNSTICMELPLLFTLLFIFFFVSGGISGMAVAHTGMDILFHDSFYVVGHFHVMFAGSAMFGSFAAFYFYFPAIFGCKYSRIWGYLHCVYYLLGQLMTVIPMIWLGYGGMPRRVLDYPAALGGWHAVTSAGHLLSVAGMLAFFIMIFDSHRQFRAATLSTLGVSRFSVRLSFYIYEVTRVRRLSSRWGVNISSYNFNNSVHLNELNFVNKEPLETTLYSYTFVSAPKGAFQFRI